MEEDFVKEMIAVMQSTPAEQDKYFMSLPKDKTSSLLIEHLENKPQSEKRDWLINRAKNLVYDDFKSILETCPKIQLDYDLRQAGYLDLAKNNINGLYD